MIQQKKPSGEACSPNGLKIAIGRIEAASEINSSS